MRRKFSKKSTTGYISHKKGEAFEQILEQGVLATGGYPIRIADGARRVGLPMPPYHRYIPVKQPFDYIAVFDDKIICLDCKSTSLKSITYSSLYPASNSNKNTKKSKETILHQIKYLSIISTAAVSGFLYYFDQEYKIVFYKVGQFKDLKPRESLKPNDGILLGNPSDFDLRKLFK